MNTSSVNATKNEVANYYEQIDVEEEEEIMKKYVEIRRIRKKTMKRRQSKILK